MNGIRRQQRDGDVGTPSHIACYMSHASAFPPSLSFTCTTIMAPSFSTAARKRALSDSGVHEINRKRVKKMGADDPVSVSTNMTLDDTVAQQSQDRPVST